MQAGGQTMQRGQMASGTRKTDEDFDSEDLAQLTPLLEVRMSEQFLPVDYYNVSKTTSIIKCCRMVSMNRTIKGMARCKHRAKLIQQSGERLN